MTMQTEENRQRFKEYFSQGVRLVSAFKNKPYKDIEKEIGLYCEREPKSIEGYRYGQTIPPDEVLLKTVDYFVRFAKVDQEWVKGILQAAEYEEWERAIEQWFPPPPEAITTADDEPNAEPLSASQSNPEPQNVLTPIDLLTQPATSLASVAPATLAPPVGYPLGAWLRRYGRMWLAIVGIVVVVIVGWFGWRQWQMARLQDGKFVLDGGFEKATDLSHWRNVGGCKMTVKEGDSIEGNHYLEVIGLDPCYSFSQDTTVQPVLRRTYTFSAWFRSPEMAYPDGQIVIWGGRRIRNEFNDLESGGTDFQIKSGEWQCISTNMTVTNPDTSILRAEIYLKGFDGQVYQVDDVQFIEGAESPCPATPPQIYNASFEERSDGIPPWLTESSCEVTVRNDAGVAHEGQAFISIVRRESDCHSFRQVVNVNAQPDETYHFSLWMRSSDTISRTAEIVIWGKGGIEEKSWRFYTLEGAEWQCMEATLQTQQSGPLELILEFYVHHNQVGTEFWVDDASFQMGVSESCPRDSLQITDLSLPFGTNATYYAGAVVPVVAEISNQGTTDREPKAIQYWITPQPNADDLEGGGSPNGILIPALTPNSIYQRREDYIFVPIGLPPGQYYAVAQLVGTTERYTLDEPITIAACESDLFYCDMSEDNWAYPATQQWAEARISNGCRSGTEPYLNRPFCPKQIVDNGAIALFLLRQLKGADFQPGDPGEGYYYTDIPPDHVSRMVFEYFHQNGVELLPTGCSGTINEPQICPFQFVTRGDLARYLAMVLHWDIDSITITNQTALIDLPDDEFTRKAILYMDIQGFLNFSEPDCLPVNGQRRFCPDLPLRRANAAAMMTRAFAGSEIPTYP